MSNSTGRPPAELHPERRKALALTARRLATLEAKVDAARRDLAVAAAVAADDGASWAVIGEAIGRSKAVAGELIAAGRLYDPHRPARNRGGHR
jgi:hypothetical protein